MVIIIPSMLPFLGISKILSFACGSSWVCNMVLFFCSIVAARTFISAICSGNRVSLLLLFLGFCCFCVFCGVSSIMKLLLPKIC